MRFSARGGMCEIKPKTSLIISLLTQYFPASWSSIALQKLINHDEIAVNTHTTLIFVTLMDRFGRG
jgi:hypothetical protein